ncbi:MAG: CDF family Co(II)/Ni(II) efflux transporter DmeF [Phenylobacterium sp.]
MTETARIPPTAELDAFQKDRTYLGADHRRNERRTWLVTAICAVMLAVQVGGGLAFRSMALTAAGLHMAAHVAALLVAAAAYALARRHAENPAFAFGTGKLGYLAGFANACVLAITAVLIGAESLVRLLNPESVDFESALPLAVAALGVNLVCVWLLKPTHAHAMRGDRDGDLNLTAAHLHLTADAAVSLLAILAMLAGERLGWAFADPLAGLAGAVLVGHFAWTLLRKAGAALLDINPSAELTAEVRARLGAEGEQVVDLHLWRLGPGHHAAIAVVSADHPLSPQAYRDRLKGLAGLSHVTIEVQGPGDGHHHGHSHD